MKDFIQRTEEKKYYLDNFFMNNFQLLFHYYNVLLDNDVLRV